MATTRTVTTAGGVVFGGSAKAWQPNFAPSGGALSFSGSSIQQQNGKIETVALTVGVVAAISTTSSINNESAAWNASVRLGGVDVSTSILQSITIEASENAARVADIVYVPNAGALVPESYPGKQVEIVFIANNEFASIFSGVVDSFELDANDGVLRLKCTDGFQTQIEAASRNQIDGLTGGAYWSAWVFDENAQGWQYAQDRLSTITNELHLTVGKQFESVNQFASGSPDYSFTAADILDGSLDVEVAQRSQIVNDYRIIFEYRFPLLKQQNVSLSFSGLTPQEIWCSGVRIPNRTMIDDLVDQLGLHEASVSVSELPAYGSFTCGMTTGIFRNNAVGHLITSGSLNGKRRMVQTITEKYELSITAPDSIAVYGSLVQNDDASGSVEFDTGAWTDFKTAPATSTQVAMTTQSKDGRAVANAAIVCLLNRARATIKKSHRATIVRVGSTLKPLLSLAHTIAVNAGGVNAKGKVSRFTHKLDFDEGSASTLIECSVSKLPTSNGSDSTLAAPSAPSLPAYGLTGNITIPTYIDDAGDNGSGFYTYTGNNKNNVSFRMVATLPEIPAVQLDPLTLNRTANFTSALVSDTFSITV
jgi:hypothetical protein